MAYFRENEEEQKQQYVPYFQNTNERETEVDDGFDEILNPEEEELPDEELEARRKDRLELIMHLGDFTAVIIGVVMSLILIALLISLLSWLQSDISQTFSLMESWI